VIHVNNMPDFLVFSTVVAKVFGAKIILDIHDPMPNTFASKFGSEERGFFYRILLWQELLSASFANQVVTVHDPVKEHVLIKHGLSAESIFVVANFPDTEVFEYRERDHGEDKIQLVFHGTILERAGLDNLIVALSKVQNRDRIRAKIIGEGDFSDQLHTLIREHGVEDIVEFDNQAYPVHEIPLLISDCNVGIVPLQISSITNYALPLKLMEYIAMGLPVITVRSVAICHYLSDDDCLFYDWDDVESLSHTLDAVAEDPKMLDRFRERSLMLREKYSWRREKEKYISLLKKLASNA